MIMYVVYIYPLHTTAFVIHNSVVLGSHACINLSRINVEKSLGKQKPHFVISTFYTMITSFFKSNGNACIKLKI